MAAPDVLGGGRPQRILDHAKHAKRAKTWPRKKTGVFLFPLAFVTQVKTLAQPPAFGYLGGRVWWCVPFAASAPYPTPTCQCTLYYYIACVMHTHLIHIYIHLHLHPHLHLHLPPRLDPYPHPPSFWETTTLPPKCLKTRGVGPLSLSLAVVWSQSK